GSRTWHPTAPGLRQAPPLRYWEWSRFGPPVVAGEGFASAGDRPWSAVMEQQVQRLCHRLDGFGGCVQRLAVRANPRCCILDHRQHPTGGRGGLVTLADWERLGEAHDCCSERAARLP